MTNEVKQKCEALAHIYKTKYNPNDKETIRIEKSLGIKEGGTPSKEVVEYINKLI